MPTAILALLIVTVVLSLLLLALHLRGRGRADPTLMQQQLIELRARLDSVIESQQQVPRALAEGSAEQARSLGEVREQLVRLFDATSRLETMGKAQLRTRV